MSFDIVQIKGLWHAIFANGHQTEGFKNANQAIGAGNAYVQGWLIRGGK